MSCSKSFHQTAFHVKGSCCATCHRMHVGLLHVTFGPSVRSCSARHWMFFEIHVSEVEWVPGGVFNPLAGLEVQKENHQAPSIKPSCDPCPTFRQLFYKTARCYRCSCAFFSQRKTFSLAQLGSAGLLCKVPVFHRVCSTYSHTQTARCNIRMEVKQCRFSRYYIDVFAKARKNWFEHFSRGSYVARGESVAKASRKLCGLWVSANGVCVCAADVNCSHHCHDPSADLTGWVHCPVWKVLLTWILPEWCFQSGWEVFDLNLGCEDAAESLLFGTWTMFLIALSCFEMLETTNHHGWSSA